VPHSGFWLLLVGALAVSPLGAQTVTLQGETTDSAAAVVTGILARGDYLLVDRDTVFGPEWRLPGDLVVVDSRVALEGWVGGAVAVIRGDFFVRPRGVVEGAIVALDAGAFVSGLASGGPVLELDPRVRMELSSIPIGYMVVLEQAPDPPPLRFPSLFGFGLPTFDRVNGLSIPWSTQLALGGEIPWASLSGTVIPRLSRRAVDGRAELTLRPVERVGLTLAVTRDTRTPDAWIRGDLANSLSALFVRSDVRNYFLTEEISATLTVAPPSSLVQGEGFVVPVVRVRVSRDQSLDSADPRTLLRRGEGWRPNPDIDDGTLVSLVGGARAGWRGGSSRFSGVSALEWAPPDAGDFEFTQSTTAAQWWMRALWDHQITVRGFLLATIGGRPAPRQRWSHIGGPGTLPTLPMEAMRGDHVAFVGSAYTAPIPRLRLPVIGQPALRLEHAAGAAWRTGEPRPPLEQNVGAGIQASIFHASLVANPADLPLRPRLHFGFHLQPPPVTTHF